MAQLTKFKVAALFVVFFTGTAHLSVIAAKWNVSISFTVDRSCNDSEPIKHQATQFVNGVLQCFMFGSNLNNLQYNWTLTTRSQGKCRLQTDGSITDVCSRKSTKSKAITNEFLNAVAEESLYMNFRNMTLKNNSCNPPNYLQDLTKNGTSIRLRCGGLDHCPVEICHGNAQSPLSSPLRSSSTPTKSKDLKSIVVGLCSGLAALIGIVGIGSIIWRKLKRRVEDCSEIPESNPDAPSLAYPEQVNGSRNEKFVAQNLS